MVALAFPLAPPAVSPADAPSLARLHDAVEALASDDVARLTDAALGDDLVDLRRHIDRLELEFSRRLQGFDARRGWSGTGAVSTVAWLRSACRLSPSAAAQQLGVARQLPDLPLTSLNALDGTIGFHHVAVITHCASQVGTHAVRAVEPTLVEAARKVDPCSLRIVTRRLRYCVDPDGAFADSELDHARRSLNVSQTFDGVFHVDGLLDAEGGALLRTALDALDDRVQGDDRTAWQRRADALVELARRQLQSGSLPSVAGERPHLTVTTSEATLRAERGCAAGEMGWAGPVVAETVRRVACDASVRRVVVGAGGEPLDVGRATRTIPAAVRRALVVRDGGCRFPGCDRPPEWTDGHHIEHWADGGATKLDNLVLLCRRHHRVVHEGHWWLEVGPGGAVVAQPP